MTPCLEKFKSLVVIYLLYNMLNVMDLSVEYDMVEAKVLMFAEILFGLIDA